MRQLAILALLTACGGSTQIPPPVASVPMPDGSQLAPYDPAHPGKARPQGMTEAAGRVYVTLSNQRDTATFPVNAGPGFLVALVPASGATTLIDLGGSDGHQCQNPGTVRTSADGKVYASCSGNFSGTDTARAIVEVDPATNQATRRASIPDGRVPNGVAVTSTRIWTGDAMTSQIFSIDRGTFVSEATPPIPIACPKSDRGFTYVPDLLAIGGDVYALCASDISGAIFRLDGVTGAVKAQAALGAGPTELAGLDDGRIAVVHTLDNTLWLVTPAGGTLSAQKVLTFSSQTAALQDIRAAGHVLFTTASGSNTAQRIDLDAAGGPKVVSEANFGQGAGPYDILPLDSVQAIVSNRGTNTVAAASWVNAQ